MKQESQIGGYHSSLEHLLDELRRIDLLIRRQVVKFRIKGRDPGDPLRGLCIQKEEIDAILAEDVVIDSPVEDEPSQLKHFQEHLAALEAQISINKATCISAGGILRLEQLKKLFGLSSFDLDILMLCLAPELELHYEKLYAYLQDDVTRKRPSVDLVLSLLCSSFKSKLTMRKYFAPSAPLIKYRLVYLFSDPSHLQPPLISKYVKLDDRVVNFLLGSNEIDGRLAVHSRLCSPRASLEDLQLPPPVKDRLLQLVDGKDPTEKGAIFYFQGPYGVGKQTTAEALCREVGIRLLSVDVESLINDRDMTFETAVNLVSRESLLQNAALYWDNFDALLADDKRAALQVLFRSLKERRGLAFLAGDRTWEPMDALHESPFFRIKFPRPRYSDRLELWHKSLNGDTPLETDVGVEDLANKFRFSGGQIQDAVATARNLARWRTPHNGKVNMEDLYDACRAHSNHKLAQLSRKIKPPDTWSDIVLPADQLAQLREITKQVKYQHKVYGDWGFDRKLSLGKGLTVLFHGPPGTGKTMAAGIMANELQLDLYKIDLSTVVSKYIGETEKNLSKIFKEAEASNAILFFDEADALFGKRSEVKDAHDRYANIEIAYLLQKMEEYEGITILATNLMQNVDEAFVRRIRFIVEFPFPKEAYRLRIWQVIWPRNTPLSPEVDLSFMAEQFELAGGAIRNIALNAAFFAAENGRSVTMQHLIQATRREFQKMGKLFVKADFGAFREYA
ncbi:ATPase, AAA family [Olavius sp. associated proteobacterium Delta 1]|nr:ATPase, AAA family [Olavius sp. associated proteobacterium Delta 1]